MRILLFLFLAFISCGSFVSLEKSETHVALPMGSAECSSCGMILRDQPPPRGQLIHRDGEHVFFCSIGDLIHYMETPSPHGAVQEVFIEGLSVDYDFYTNDVSELSWFPTHELAFQVGVERPGIMGVPILAFPKEQTETSKNKDFLQAFHSWAELPGLVHELEKREPGPN